MADDNSNIFDAGNSGPESGTAATAIGGAGSGEGTPGRIDPAIAADIAEGIRPADTGRRDDNNNGGSGGDTGQTSGNVGGERASTGRRRGRPPGSGKIKEESTLLVGSTLAGETLQLMHLLASMALSAPELKLDDDDAEKVGKALAKVLALNDMRLTPKQAAYAELIKAAAQVYPPMVISIIVRKKMEQQAKPQTQKPPSPKPQAPHNVGKVESNVVAMNTGGFDPTKIELPQ